MENPELHFTRRVENYIKYRPLAATATAVHRKGSDVRVPVRCSPATVAGCHGRITLKSGRRTLGSVAYSYATGRRAAARIKLSRRGLAYVKRHRVTKASLIVRDVDTTGVATTTTQTIRIGR